MTKLNMILFTNWLNEEFVGKWAGEQEVFKSGQSKYLEGWKARHYAKHLVDQYLNEKDLPTNHFSRKDLEKKCFGEVEEVSEVNADSKIFNKNKELEKKKLAEKPEESIKSKKPIKPEQKPVEKEFEELNVK